jgi:hypothetical protein
VQEGRGQNENDMADKTPVRVVFNSSSVATGLAEFQSGETVPVANGGTGLSSIGSAGQILKVNAAGDGLAFAGEGDISIQNLVAPTNADLSMTTSGTGNIILNDLTIADNSISTNRSNDDLKINASGSGTVVLENLKVGTSGATVTTILDEDDLSTDSATSLATQQSVKAYVDSQVSSVSTTAISQNNSNVTVADSGTGNVTIEVDGTDRITTVAATTTTATGHSLVIGASSTTVGGKIKFLEGTDNGTNGVTLVGAASTADVDVILPAAADTLVGKATTDTLTNKSIDLGNNTLTGSLAEFNSALQSESFVSLTGSETLTNKTLTSPTISAPTITGTATIGAVTTNAITSNGSNADISIQPSGTGDVLISALRVNGTTLDSSDSSKITIAEALDVTGAFTNASVTITGGTITGITDLTVADGGTGASSFTDGGVLLGSGSGAITAMSALGDGEVIVGDGSGDPVAESGATLRTSIGVGTGDSPQFTGIELGHATDTTITRASSGDLNVEGNLIYRAGGTDVPVADGGTGASSLTDNAVLTGTGTSAITAEGNLSFDGSTLAVTGAVTISGNLTVNGDTTTVSSTNTTIEDNILELNTGISASHNDAGIIIERGSTGDNAAIIWDESADKFILGTTTATAGDKSGGITLTAGALEVAELTTGSITTNEIASNGSNADVNITPQGTGKVIVNNLSIDGELGNIISSASNMDITFTPHGTGSVVISQIKTNSVTGEVVPGKFGGTDFSNSMLIGHSTTGTLDAAEYNTGVGIGSLDALTTGDYNTAVGYNAGTSITTGGESVLIGAGAGDAITSSNYNIAIGRNALGAVSSSANGNTAIGRHAMKDSTGAQYNTAIGGSALEDVTGYYNIGLGVQAGDNITSGSGNVIIGYNIDAGSATANRQLKIAGNDDSTTTTWISGDNSGNLTFPADVTLGDDLHLDSDASVLKFGDDGEITLTHVHDTGLLLQDSGGTPTLQLHDSNESIASDGSKVIITSGGTSFSLPTADGDENQALITDGAGTLSFGTVGSLSASDDSAASVVSNKRITSTARTIDAFNETFQDSVLYYVVSNDHHLDVVNIQKISVCHNDTGPFISSAGAQSGTGDMTTFTAASSNNIVRVKAASTNAVGGNVSFYKFGLGDNTSTGTSGNVIISQNTDVDSASESIVSFAHASYRGAKLFVSVNNNGKSEVSNCEALVVHDGTEAFITQFNTVNSGNNDLLTLTAAISGSNVVISGAGLEPNLRVTVHAIMLKDTMTANAGSYNNAEAIAPVTISSTATEFDTLNEGTTNGAVYYLLSKNATEGEYAINEVFVAIGTGDITHANGGFISTKGTNQLAVTTEFKDDVELQGAIKLASTSGGSTTVSAYMIKLHAS